MGKTKDVLLKDRSFSAPIWANYITRDNKGLIIVFEKKPVLRMGMWSTEEDVDRMCILGYELPSFTCQEC
jgi:hypothetical protein